MNKFAEILTKLMDEEKVSQKELAEYLNVSQSNISRYINRINEPSLDTFIKIAKFFGVTSNYLLGVED